MILNDYPGLYVGVLSLYGMIPLNYMSAKKFQITKIQQLRKFLAGALLINKDKDFANSLIQKLEAAPINTTTQSACLGLQLLLDQDKITRAKTTRRFAVSKIDIFKQHLNRYTDKELITILRACHLIQMTDGCTVACSWCYLNAQPYIQFAISFSSIRRLLKEFAHIFPDPTRFYWATDPLDWYDGEKSYVDLVDEFYTETKKTKSVVTTTSLPMGAEFTFLRLIQWFDKNLSFKQSLSFLGDEQHYLKNNMMKGLFYQKSQSYDINSFFDYQIKNLFYHQKTHHVLKISETDANYKRLKAIFDILQFMGISESCLSWIEVEMRDKGNFDGVRKSGRAYGWKDRETLKDTVSMACWDSTILFPGKIGAMEMCGVTSKTQRGLEFWLIEPGKQIIPHERVIERAEYLSNNSKTKKYLLPYLEMTEYSLGEISKRWTHYSLNRDIQAYGLLLSKILPQVEFMAKQTGRQLSKFIPWQEIQKQYKERKVISDKLLRQEKDEEIIRLVRYMIEHIDCKLQL